MQGHFLNKWPCVMNTKYRLYVLQVSRLIVNWKTTKIDSLIYTGVSLNRFIG